MPSRKLMSRRSERHTVQLKKRTFDRSAKLASGSYGPNQQKDLVSSPDLNYSGNVETPYKEDVPKYIRKDIGKILVYHSSYAQDEELPPEVKNKFYVYKTQNGNTVLYEKTTYTIFGVE